MSLRRGLAVQSTIVWALILRETRTRFGMHKLGYVWALLEPTLMILTFYVLFQIFGRIAPYDMDFFGFLTTGMIPYLLFMSCLTSVAESINGNKALLYYPHVQPLDLMIGRTLLETATYILVFLVLMFGYALVVQDVAIHDPLLVAEGMLLAALLGASCGMVWCSLGQMNYLADRIRGPLLRPMFWISGLFFALNELPTEYRNVVAKNPLIHPVEMIRDGWYSTYTAHYADPAYTLAFCLVFLFLGLALERVIRRRIELS